MQKQNNMTCQFFKINRSEESQQIASVFYQGSRDHFKKAKNNDKSSPQTKRSVLFLKEVLSISKNRVGIKKPEAISQQKQALILKQGEDIYDEEETKFIGLPKKSYRIESSGAVHPKKISIFKKTQQQEQKLKLNKIEVHKLPSKIMNSPFEDSLQPLKPIKSQIFTFHRSWRVKQKIKTESHNRSSERSKNRMSLTEIYHLIGRQINQKEENISRTQVIPFFHNRKCQEQKNNQIPWLIPRHPGMKRHSFKYRSQGGRQKYQ